MFQSKAIFARARDLSLRKKFLIVPFVATLGMLLLGFVFLDNLDTQRVLLSRIADEELVQIDRLSKAFSDLGANHVTIFDLLASAGTGANEEQIYEGGKRNLYRIHELVQRVKQIGAEGRLSDRERALHGPLIKVLEQYRGIAVGAIEMASVNVALATRQMVMANKSFSDVNSNFLLLLDEARHESNTLISTLNSDSQKKATHFAFLLVAAIIIMTILTVALTAVLSNEIRAMAVVMAKLAQGDTSIDIPHEARKDEVGTMARAVGVFKRSLIRLSQSELTATEMNKNLEREIQQKTQAQEALREANEDLERKVERRTHDLTESLEQQIATGEILRVISESLTEAQPVFDAIVNSCVRLFDGVNVSLQLVKGDQMELVGSSTLSGAPADLLPLPLNDNQFPSSRAILQRGVVHIQDVREALWLLEKNRQQAERKGFRAIVSAPMLRESDAIGAITVMRSAPGPFTEKQIALLKIFADQAVIAIENARMFNEIQDKTRQIEAASLHKSQFLANMSHELRTPLNAIIGYSEMLQEDAAELEAEQFVADLKKIHASGQHLLELINAVLDLSKIEAGKMDLYLESFNVASVVAGVAEIITPLAQKKSNRLEVECAENVGAMHADLTKVRQALFNLLSNACKFTENGTVTLSVQRERTEGGDWMVFRVHDSGIGMTPEQIGRLFQEFSQADASTTRKYGGTGLGLALSRRMSQMMGGDIMVQSEPGRGSTFTLRLPADVKAPAAEAAPAAAAVRPRPGTGGALVLVVDDDAAVRETMEHFLTREGYSVATASGGHEALRLARELRPAAIMLDVMMPDLDGWTVLAALKGDPELADIPAILVSFVDEKKRGYSLGATEYMVKPINRERLFSVLRSLCPSAARSILVVDDDDALRTSVVRTLSGNGWNVTEAVNGKAALSALGDARPDAIVLDLMMPEMDGFEFLAEFRARAEWRAIPVIVVTAKDLADEDRRRLSGGVEHIFQKSACSREEFLDELARALTARVGPGRIADTAGSSA